MHHAGIPTILFGAFDRHNFGDLLFPHVAETLLRDKNLIFAGLAERDMRSHGGHHVQALATLARQWDGHPVNIVHAGGELLTCDAWEAAVMLLPPDQAQQIITRFNGQPWERQKWSRHMLGVAALAPYTVAPELFPGARVIYDAVGGVDLERRDPDLRREVLEKLKAAGAAGAVGVRDGQTQAVLAAAGIACRLMPDPAVMVSELFGEKIRGRAQQHALARILHTFPQGYIAIQFSADFGSGDMLAAIATQLDRAVSRSGLGVVFFRAGAAPWHDDLCCYRRTAALMHAPARTFISLDLWDICALIAYSRVYAGSSLHGRIVAMAFALPRINLRHPHQVAQCTKQEAFAASWEAAGVPAMVDVPRLGDGILRALAVGQAQLRNTAQELTAQYRSGFELLRAELR